MSFHPSILHDKNRKISSHDEPNDKYHQLTWTWAIELCLAKIKLKLEAQQSTSSNQMSFRKEKKKHNT